MKQAVRTRNTKTQRGTDKPKAVRRPKTSPKPRRKHPQYGTSKLEERFAKEFLDKLGVDYVYQFEAKDIGRFYDFRIAPESRGPIIELNGTYFHSDPRVYESTDLNAMQKRNMRVDEYKRKWCEKMGIKLIYIWEKDVNERPSDVMNYLKTVLAPYTKENLQEKKSRHVSVLKK